MKAKYEESMDMTIKTGIKRLNSLFETYRHKREMFTAMQRIGDGLSWIVEKNKLYIEYIESIPNREDIRYRSQLCANFTKCYFDNKEIEKIIHWFTSSLHRDNVLDWNKK